MEHKRTISLRSLFFADLPFLLRDEDAVGSISSMARFFHAVHY